MSAGMFLAPTATLIITIYLCRNQIQSRELKFNITALLVVH